jgi:hypothetical protein
MICAIASANFLGAYAAFTTAVPDSLICATKARNDEDAKRTVGCESDLRPL